MTQYKLEYAPGSEAPLPSSEFKFNYDEHLDQTYFTFDYSKSNNQITLYTNLNNFQNDILEY